MKRPFTKICWVGIASALLLLFFTCASLKTAENLVGKWVGDSDSFFADPEIKKEIENNPMGDKMSAYMDSIVSSLRIEIASDSLTISEQIPGEDLSKVVIKYRINNQTKDTVMIENINSKGKDGKMIIRIIDPDHIKISPEKKIEGQPDFILKRAQ